MKSGYFDDKNKEYVITTPRTPYPWINYLGKNDFFSIVSNTAGGYAFYKDARLRRLMRCRYNNIPLGSNGRYFYITDGETVWNPSWQPCQTELDSYECHHGFGYTRFLSSKNSLKSDLLFFVSDGESPVASYRTEFEIKAGRERTFVFLLGYVENNENEKFDLSSDAEKNLLRTNSASYPVNKKKAMEIQGKFNSREKVLAAFENLKKSWRKILSKFTLKSGDEKLDRMVLWNQYQCVVTCNFARSASCFESGIGRGIGFRDTSQDLPGVVHSLPRERLRGRLFDVAATQFADGSAYHQFQPLTKTRKCRCRLKNVMQIVPSPHCKKNAEGFDIARKNVFQYYCPHAKKTNIFERHISFAFDCFYLGNFICCPKRRRRENRRFYFSGSKNDSWRNQLASCYFFGFPV